jgi:hypothetical protein
LPDFSWSKHSKTEKIYQFTINCTKRLYIHKLYQMAVKYSKLSSNVTIFSIPRPSKFYPNWDFWFENKSSGNPGRNFRADFFDAVPMQNGLSFTLKDFFRPLCTHHNNFELKMAARVKFVLHFLPRKKWS